ncbi:MAG: hypothetical protein ACHQIO_07480 [Nevskiales bacterium]
MNHLFQNALRAPRRAAPYLLCLPLAACSGAVGQGNAPKLLVISRSGVSVSETAGLASLRMYECLPSVLAATMYFQDGSSGDFTARVHWSSSDPGTLKISNGDIAVANGSGSYYAPGTLVPVISGSVIATADYDGISAQIAISIGTPQSITVKTLVDGNEIVPDGRYFSLGAGTTQSLQVTAWLDGVETDVSSYAGWSLLQPNDSEATIDAGSGLITAVAAGSQLLTPVAGFAPCTLNNISDPSNALDFTVQHIQGIAIEPEFSGNPQLIVGNTEKMNVVATLDDGYAQNLNGLATLSSSDAEIAAAAGSLLSAVAAGGPAIIGASFTGTGVTYTAPSLTVSTATATLQTVSICWTAVLAAFSACPAAQGGATVVAGSLTPVQFHAIGTYDAGTLTQDITRQVTWASSDPTAATIGGSGNSIGQALGITAQSSVTITGSDSAAQNITSARQQLLVQ